MGPRKHLLFVIPSLTGGGAERVLVNLLNHLDRSRYDVTLVLFENIMTYKTAIDFPVRWIQLGKVTKWDVFKVLFRLRKTIAELRPDVVMASLYYANILTITSVVRIGRRPRIIVCEHSDPRVYPALYRFLIRRTYKYADIIVAVSSMIGRILACQFHVDAANIRVIHNPVPVESITANARDHDLDHPFVVSRSWPLIVGMGRLTQVKRFDRLLEAFAVLHRINPEARLVILGDGPLRGRLEAFSISLGLREVVSFEGFQSNPYPWIAEADLFVLSSDVEGLPMAVLEAMALGTCVLATDTPSGPREIIEDRINGRLVPRETGDLAEAMCELSQDVLLRSRLAHTALETVTRYRIEKILPAYYEIF